MQTRDTHPARGAKAPSGHTQGFHSSSATQRPKARPATVPRETTAKRLTRTISFTWRRSHFCHSQTQMEISPESVKITIQHEARSQPEHTIVLLARGLLLYLHGVAAAQAGRMTEKVLRRSLASNTVLSSGTTSTTPKSMKPALKTAKDSPSHFPATRTPAGAAAELPFGALSSKKLLYVTSPGSPAKARGLRYLPCWSRSASRFQLCVYDLKESFNSSTAELFNRRTGRARILASCLLRLYALQGRDCLLLNDHNSHLIRVFCTSRALTNCRKTKVF